MLTTRLVGAALLAVLASGCSLDSIWNDGPVLPVRTVAATAQATATATETAPAEEPEQDTYTGELASKATCTRASKILLNELEDTAGVGAAITYPQGMVVKSVHGWWTVAVATAVHANSGGYTRETVPAVAYFAATGSHPADGADVSREAPANTASAKKALACLKKLPAVKPDPKPASPADSYNGKPATGAACRKVSDTLLSRLQEVGQVGGAITYPRGQMVRANKKWWTVAVATDVHANSQGYTRANVPEVAYFVTSAPSFGKGKSGAYSFPIKGKDRAAAKALSCLTHV